ncbi:spermidine synthase [Archaeoglobus sp.]
MLLALAIVLLSTGASTMIYEVVLIREFTVILGSSFYSSAVVLSSVMLGLSIGAYVFGRLSKTFNPVKTLFAIEIAIALISIVIVPLARKTANFDWDLEVILSFLIPLIPATLMGGEIPLAVKIASKERCVGEATGICYSLDTLGGIIGSIASGFILIPTLGSLKTVLFAGILNTFGALSLNFLNYEVKMAKVLKRALILLIAVSVIVVTYVTSNAIDFSTQSEIYEGFYVLNVTQTMYQTIVIAYHDYLGRCLFLDGSLQISDVGDEPYSEAITLPALVTLLSHRKPIDVLIIGGGDLGVAEVLTRFPKEDVRSIELVELDPKVVELSKKYLKSMNRECWKDKRLKIIYEDCRKFLKDTRDKFDLVIVDLPDPKDDLSATMYSLEFYNTIYNVLRDDGIMVTQATAADYALGNQSFAVIVKTVQASKFPIVRPYRYYVPSFGMWGFVLASKRYDPLNLTKEDIRRVIKGIDLHTYDEDVHFAMFALPPWLKKKIESAEVNTIDKPVLLYTESG